MRERAESSKIHRTVKKNPNAEQAFTDPAWRALIKLSHVWDAAKVDDVEMEAVVYHLLDYDAMFCAGIMGICLRDYEALVESGIRKLTDFLVQNSDIQ